MGRPRPARGPGREGTVPARAARAPDRRPARQRGPHPRARSRSRSCSTGDRATCTSAAAETGERPRETLLLDELRRRRNRSEPGTRSPTRSQSLIVRLEPYCEGGALAHLTDQARPSPDETTLTLFDIAGLPDRLAPPMILQIVDHIEGRDPATRGASASHGELNERRRVGRANVPRRRGGLGADRLARRPGAWLNEYARRSRHYALWLSSSRSSSGTSPPRKATRCSRTSVDRACACRTTPTISSYARDPLGLTETDIEQITTLTTPQRLYSTVYMVSNRGRGAVRVALGDLEYWICCSTLSTTSPTAPPALTRPAVTTWAALRLLCTPAWHERHRGRAVTDRRTTARLRRSHAGPGCSRRPARS